MRTVYAHIIGRRHNIDVAKSMTSYFIGEVLRLSREYSSVRGEQLRFAKGCGMGLSERILQMVHDREQAQTQSSGRDLVVQETDQLDRWIQKNMETTTRPTRPVRVDEDSVIGRIAAQGIGIHSQLED